MDEIQQYDDFAVKHLAAFNAFSTIYEAKNPRPIATQVSRDRVSTIIICALTLVMIAAVIVSGSRTIAEFGGDEPGLRQLIGVTAFVMIEGGIMAYAFFRARRSASKARLERTIHWATAGLIFTVIVGLGANIDKTLRDAGNALPEGVKTVIELLVAVSAPALGFISSDVLAIELMAVDIKQREALKTDDSNLRKWQRNLNTEWKNQQRNWGVKIKVETEPMRQIPAFMNVHEQREQPKNQLTAGVLEAIDWLRINDPEAKMTVREASTNAGLSVGTMGTAKKYLRENGDG